MSTPQGKLPLLSLKNTVIFPGLSQVIRVGREKSIKALQFAEKNNFWIVAIQQKQESADPMNPTLMDLYSTGTLCRVDSLRGNSENGYQVVLRGFHRMEIESSEIHPDGYFVGNCFERPDTFEMNSSTEKALLESLKKLSQEILKLLPMNTEALSDLVKSVDDLGYLTSLCSGNIDFNLKEKQKILETFHLKDRALYLLNLMKEFKERLEIQSEIRGKLNQKLGHSQRQTILREQLKTIKEELGEGSGEMSSESQEEKLRTKILAAKMPDDVHRMALGELQRFAEVGLQSPEAHIIRNYLELLSSLPWNETSESEAEIDLDRARQILDRDHFGLDKIKRRIVQHLAVLKLNQKLNGSILLFVGPPGVGKTSLGQSVAEALGRKFVRLSLGGVRDDAEIRGHRRTYVGAMPGRIIQGLKKAGKNNPVFLLDEIDKMSRAFSGDPASAMLEVLDPEQNKNFLDHYLDVGFDLSKVFFIATANQLDTIPGPLLDRMEVIELSGYTTAEKLHIAKNHLIPKQLLAAGIESSFVEFKDPTLLRLINFYTREAGVRDLQRKITEVLRSLSERVLNLKKLSTAQTSAIVIDDILLEEILGPEKFNFELADTKNFPGVALGLAWSPVGGDLLYIEAQNTPGKGHLTITGQLGEVMKESAQIAQTLLKSFWPKISSSGGPTLDLTTLDFHVHVPAGAIPKDGPSAGVTLMTALTSLAVRRPIKNHLAMTGEITLRGSVLPVGGIKEKVIAAHRAGIKEIILPARNKKDLNQVPQEVKDFIQFHFVESVQEVLKIALNLDVFSENPMPRDGQKDSGGSAYADRLGV